MDINSILFYALILIVLAVLFGVYRAMMSPALKYHSFMYRLKAKFFFWCGRVKRLHSFPFVTWARILPKVDYRDAKECAVLARPGDIGLHREEGCLCNFGIPGAFKHAWIWTENGLIVEACQEGVMERDEFHPVVYDYSILLRPKGMSEDDVKTAIKRARSIVGCEYDANFNFDLLEEDKAVGQQYTRNISAGEYHPAFSCTETVAFSWLHKRKELGVFRTVYAGREAIIADDYLRMNCEIIWASPSVTMEWAVKEGLHEEGRFKLQEYLDKRKTA